MKKPSKLIGLIALLCLAACKDGWNAETYNYRDPNEPRYSAQKGRNDHGLDGMVLQRKITLP